MAGVLPCVGAAVPPGRGSQLSHARHPGQDRQQRPADGREQQCHAEREMPVRAEVRDVTVLPFCRMKISNSRRTTAKNATATQSPLILVCLMT